MTPLTLIAMESGWLSSALGGSVVVAMPIALLAGLVSFFSPCVLPLLPGYLSYASGLSAQEIVVDGTQRKGRMLAATVLFVLGFSVVFVLTGAVFGGIGAVLTAHARLVEVLGGVLAILLGLVFADLVPLGQRDLRPARVQAVGLAAAPLLGAAFGVGWTPCIGPTLGIVLTMAMAEATPGKGAFLAFVYALGLGIPFIVAGLAFQRFSRRTAWLKRHQGLLKRTGGGLMLVVGVLMVTGLWTQLVRSLGSLVASFGTLL